MQIFVSRRDRRNALLWLLAIVLALVITYVAVQRYAPFLTDPAALRAWIDQYGVWAPIVFIGVQILQVVIAPIPGQVMGLIGGILFGAVAGTAYSLAGGTIGSALAFWLSRRYGRQYVERVVTPAVLERFDALGENHALLGIFLAFVIPGLPDDALCFVGGLTRIRLWKLIAVSFLGRIPSYAVFNLIGSELANENLVAVLTLVTVVGALTAITYRYRDQVLARLAGDSG